LSERKRKLKAQQLSTKGEMVEHQDERQLAAEEDIFQENPYKTQPGNLTNKDRERDNEKG